MKKEDESYESVNLPNTEARLAPLLYIFRIYSLKNNLCFAKSFPTFFSV